MSTIDETNTGNIHHLQNDLSCLQSTSELNNIFSPSCIEGEPKDSWGGEIHQVGAENVAMKEEIDIEEHEPGWELLGGTTAGLDKGSSYNVPLGPSAELKQEFENCSKIFENKMLMDPSTSQLRLDIYSSDSNDEDRSSGSEYITTSDDDFETSSCTSTCSLDFKENLRITEVKKTYSRNTEVKITKINKGETRETDSESMKQRYTRKQSCRERPTICPLCFEDIITHFPRHLSRKHPDDPDVKIMSSMKPNSQERLQVISALRKRSYFVLGTEKNVLHPVRTSKDSTTELIVCTYCLGYYKKNMLYRHVKICKNKPCDVTLAGKHCQSRSQTFMTSKNHEFLRASRLKTEVFEIMRADSVSMTAKSDPLICLYGETLLAKHKRRQIATHVSNKMREMAKMLTAVISLHDDVTGFFDVLKPEMFGTLVAAAKIVSGYDEEEKSFRAPSLALHLGTDLKTLCNVAFKSVIKKKNIPNIIWQNRDETKRDIKDLKKLLEAHWCNEISSLALKDLKERQWQKLNHLPLTEDILLLTKYLNQTSESAYESLLNNINAKDNYKQLTECVLAQTIMFNQKRIGDVQYLKTETYERENKSTSQEEFSESLTELERLLCGQFKRVVTDGKDSKPVAVLFSKRAQKYIALLLKIRKTTNMIPESNLYLFANPGVKDKWLRGDDVIRNLAKKCGAKHPMLLTSAKFRKHIATTLQLMNMEGDEMEQVATFMGHKKKTHAQFYRLPQDIYQASKVAKILLLLEKGKGKEFRGKSLEEINLDDNYYESSDASDKEDEGKADTNIKTNKRLINSDAVKVKRENEVDSEEEKEEVQMKTIETKQTKKNLKPILGRSRWTSEEKKLVQTHFSKHIKNKVVPKKHDCEDFLAKYGDRMNIKDWVKIKTLVYNTYREK